MARRQDVRGRFAVEPTAGPYGQTDKTGMARMAERNWDVVQFVNVPGGAGHRPVTGATPVASTLARGRWDRGQIVRGTQPVFTLTPHSQYDPTDPNNWPRGRY